MGHHVDDHGNGQHQRRERNHDECRKQADIDTQLAQCNQGADRQDQTMQPLGISSMHLPEPEDDALRPFAISRAEAIRRTLQSMFESAELITVFAKNNPHCFLLTRILAIGEAGVVIDLKTDEGRIAELTRRGHCTAISLAQGVKFQFSMAIEKIELAVEKVERVLR